MNASDVEAGGAYVKIGADQKPFDAAMDSSESRFTSFIGKMRSLVPALTELGAKLILTGGALSAPAIEGIKAYEQYGAVVGKLSARTGLGAGLVGSLKYAADSFDVPIQAVAKGVSTMERGVSSGSKRTAEALGSIGLSLKSLQGQSAGDRFYTIADALSKVGDEGQRAAYAQQLFGNAGLQMLPFLAGGSAEIKRLADEARTLGTVLSDEAAENANKLHESMKRLQGSVEGTKLAIGDALYPTIKPLVDRLVEVVVYVGQQIKQNPELIVQYTKMAATIVGLGIAFVTLGGVIMAVTSPALLVAGTIALIGGAIGAVADLTSGSDMGFGQMFNAIRINGVGLGTWLSELALSIEDIWISVASRISEAFKKFDVQVNAATYGTQAKELTAKADAFRKQAANATTDEARGAALLNANKYDKQASALYDKQSGTYDNGIVDINQQKSDAAARRAAIADKMKNLFVKDDDGSSGLGFDSGKAKEGLKKLFNGAWDGIGGQFKDLLKNVPSLSFPDAKKVQGDFGPDTSPSGPMKYSSVGTFNAFGGSGIGADGTFSAILEQNKMQSESLRQIAANTERNGGGRFAGAF